MQLTRNLKSLLRSYETQLPGDQFKSFEAHIHRLVKETIEDLSQCAPGIARARRLYRLIDAEIAKAADIATSCGKGCAACCHFEVEITADEAEVLADLIRTSRVTIDRARLSELARRDRQDKAWMKGVVPQNRCVFLGDTNACRIYEDRPASCRRLSVTSPARECADPEGQPIPLVVPLAEVVLSAALNTVNNSFGAMAKMLDRRLDGGESQWDFDAPTSEEPASSRFKNFNLS